MPTPDDLRRLVADYVAAVNSRDPERIAGHFAPDAHQADPVSNPPNVGREAVRAFFAASIGAVDDWRFEAERVHTCGEHAAIDFRITMRTGETEMSISGIEVITFGDDGLIASVNAYWDDNDVAVA